MPTREFTHARARPRAKDTGVSGESPAGDLKALTHFFGEGEAPSYVRERSEVAVLKSHKRHLLFLDRMTGITKGTRLPHPNVRG